MSIVPGLSVHMLGYTVTLHVCMYAFVLTIMLHVIIYSVLHSIQSTRRLSYVERPLSKGNTFSCCRNLGSLNETWHKPPCSLLRSAVLLVQSEDSDLLQPKQCII